MHRAQQELPHAFDALASMNSTRHDPLTPAGRTMASAERTSDCRRRWPNGLPRAVHCFRGPKGTHGPCPRHAGNWIQEVGAKEICAARRKVSPLDGGNRLHDRNRLKRNDSACRSVTTTVGERRRRVAVERRLVTLSAPRNARLVAGHRQRGGHEPNGLWPAVMHAQRKFMRMESVGGARISSRRDRGIHRCSRRR